MNLIGKKFVASYSGGKDSMLAIHRAVNNGLVPIGLITTYSVDSDRSRFHGMNEDLLRKASSSLGIPLTYVKTTKSDYAASFENALMDARENGAEVCVFGDIDIKGHLDWCSARCKNTELIPYFPLEHEERKTVVHEFMDFGFSAVIRIVDTTRLPEVFLGKILSRDVISEVESHGADACGENGEYHTFVFNGPLFSEKVCYFEKEIIYHEKYAALNIEGICSRMAVKGT